MLVPHCIFSTTFPSYSLFGHERPHMTWGSIYHTILNKAMTSPFEKLSNIKLFRMATTESIVNKDYFIKKCRVHAAIKKKIAEKNPEVNHQ